MLLMVTMLGIALLPSGDARWLYYIMAHNNKVAGLPALCYYNRLVARSPKQRFEFSAHLDADIGAGPFHGLFDKTD